ncbi:uncharacterized protein YfkK (UPF0435 family) [Salsuginibacillus halophilus]|uniref:Uncharacterized protein YfkK (UPF0435 family) n=1 Tax=Salsuginibacillus halophilus TaxID=517424 RepID=A0A2P8HY61_9BACI|nr:DUF1128 domain-containing protein [Salsuginibacillus halophilus]PSL51160.1 uncharacterized protein YfkK (UPF0435 family) [Salsuginibacillus halophilus]
MLVIGLEVKSEENLAFMLRSITEQLQLVNESALQVERFAIEKYDDVKELYDFVSSKDLVSVSEMEAIVQELRNLQK